MTEKYYKTWMENIESRSDIPRIQHIEPYLLQQVKDAPDYSSILDVGCGWGTIIKHLKPNQRYLGIDKNKYFLQYIKQKHLNQHINVQLGELPSNLNIQNQKFDRTICSMVLHGTESIEESISELTKTINENGQLSIITFQDSSQNLLEKSFNKITMQDTNSITGNMVLPSGLILKNETIWFHPEKKLEGIIHDEQSQIVDKKYLGELFVAYKIKPFA